MLRDHSNWFRSVLLATDVMVSAAIFLSLRLVPGMAREAPAAEVHTTTLMLGLVAALTWPLILHHFSLYTSQRLSSLGRIAEQLLVSGAVSIVVLTAAAFALHAPVAPSFPLVCGLAQLAALASLRLFLFGALRLLRRQGRNYRNLLVIGSGPRAVNVRRVVDTHPSWGLRIIGFVDDGGVAVDPAVPSERVYKFAQVPNLLRDQVVDEVIVACPRSMLASIGPIVHVCATAGVPITLLSDLFGDYVPPPRVTHFDALAALSFAPVHHSRPRLAVKRAIDFGGAAVGLVVFAPVIALAGLAIRLTSPGPVFFRQIRCGLNGRRFTLFKLRTMYQDAEQRLQELLQHNEMDGPVFKIRKDPRITPVGRFLRAFSIDEIPQLWNVLRGDMSLVGPRPPLPFEVAQYGTGERRRLSMRPGITCLWQVSGRNALTFAEWVKLDVQYIDTWSLANDFRILARTVPAVLRGTGV